MAITNVEIKARCTQPNVIRTLLKEQQADFKGIDHQVDTYFNVPEGRLKLRQGTIEQNLIYYRRPDSPEPKTSDIHLVPAEHPKELLGLLNAALDLKVVVDKQREIYFIDNVKFHIDEVKDLGHFVEIEAIDEDGAMGEKDLQKQCRFYMELLNIQEKDLVPRSYSDMLMEISP